MDGFKEKEKVKKRISFDLPYEKHYEIKMAATSMGKTIKELIEDALYEYSKALNKEKFSN